MSSEIKDWRGTPIEIGSLIMWGSVAHNHGIGRVTSFSQPKQSWRDLLINAKPLISTTPSSGKCLRKWSVTVLTDDLLELIVG